MSSKMTPRSPTSSRSSGSSHSATMVNLNSTETTPQIPHQPAASITASSSASIATSSSSSAHTADDDASYSPYELKPVDGWPKLAQVMAKTPDFAAFPRFRELNVKSLLYYQVQLTVLQKELWKRECEDKLAEAERPVQSSEFAELLLRKVPVESEQSREDSEPQSADGHPEQGQPNGPSKPECRRMSETEQFKIIKEIRSVLKEYNDALLQYSQISALPDPDPYNIHSLRNWIRHEDGGAVGILGEGSKVWGKPTTKVNVSLWRQFRTLLWTLVWPQGPPTDKEYYDLIATRPPSKLDGLTQWFAWYFVPFYYACKDRLRPFYHACKAKFKKSKDADVEEPANNSLQMKEPKDWEISPEREATIENVSESSLVRITSGISTVVACLLPVVAIAVLSQVHGTRDLLLCLAGFSVVFCVGLIFMTQGTSKRVEIFSATAAFSAVMVVFMSDPVIVVTPGNPYPAPINITSPRT
ncbi:hypothetical protein CC80DRAFT_541911 [Byssothecium circinans]|uniref:DUF6594 domain-containing protein n=1 Tax=Byssothecium circinans TaxID=147558 RepID=A0A6A5UC55_9PLEO|nr:hypothetical protein CC80DRAFT_541911 [Byssothecium circinans]